MTYRLAVTPGEPAGIGPDVIVQLVQQGSPHELVAYADPELLLSRAKQLKLPLVLREPSATPLPLSPGELCISPFALANTAIPGQLDTANASYVLETLHNAATDCMAGKAAALVTGPVQKSVINDAGIVFSGHTEFFAQLSNTPRVVMMLAAEGLRVALVTTHLPLSQVAEAINAELLEEIIIILHQDLADKFAIAQPNIMVCGLNPHAGEGGHLGKEEQTIIEPLLNQLRAKGLSLLGPVPADTAFTPRHIAQADAILAMYHDQGLPVLKHMGFGSAVNITLGLPFIRTSVDHGTALDLAGKGNADSGSFSSAINYAAEMVANRFTNDSNN